MTGTDLDRSNTPHPTPTYDPQAPSAAFGWHGHFSDFAPKGSRILFILFALTMFAMLIGNHVSRVENYYLIGTGLLVLCWLAVRTSASRRRRRHQR